MRWGSQKGRSPTWNSGIPELVTGYGLRATGGAADADEVDEVIEVDEEVARVGVLGTAGWSEPAPWPGPVKGVLFDRDGTLVHDEPYNGDPELVRLVADAVVALERVRNAGLRLGLVSNQSGIGKRLLTAEAVEAVNARLVALAGPFDTIRICPHTEDDGCQCRKPKPGLVLAAAADLGIPPWQLALVGDIGSDMSAAEAAGAFGILVPTPSTRAEEVASAPRTASSLSEAIDLILPLAVRP